MLDQFWLWSMQSGLKNAYECIKAFSETDFTEDLKKIDVPTLVIHGDDDQIVPVHDSARKSARLIKGEEEIYYPGAPHGLTATLQDRVNADLLGLHPEQELRPSMSPVPDAPSQAHTPALLNSDIPTRPYGLTSPRSPPAAGPSAPCRRSCAGGPRRSGRGVVA